MIQNLGHLEQPSLPWLDDSNGLVTYTTELRNRFGGSHHLRILYLQTETARKISIFNEQALQENLPGDDPESQFESIVVQGGLPHLNLLKPWPLETVRIKKPWGAEIWYTGIEPRGVCSASHIPLDLLFDILPKQDVGSAQSSAPLLLKILDPHPEPAMGDLYFELHEEKIEVYIVTSIDQTIWPSGIGQIRYGFNQSKRKTFEDDDAFKAAYLESVDRYRSVRQKIDDRLDQNRTAAGLDLLSDVDPATMSNWLREIPSELRDQENTLKQAMDSFIHVRNLQIGDVVTVEPFFPHSLMHGVRVIEFQTASYERHILSFNQKVLTQNQWDTRRGLELATLDAAPAERLETIEASDGIIVELVADFVAFRALRVILESGSNYALSNPLDYALAIAVTGNVRIDVNNSEVELREEQAVFLAPQKTYVFHANTNSTLLIAEPKTF